MGDPWDDAELVREFQVFAESSSDRVPLNAALGRILARDRSLATLLGHAPAQQRLPVLLLDAVHFELLGDPQSELAEWYRNLTPEPRSPDDPRLAEVFRRFVHDHSPGIIASVAERHVQTNEVGRTALIVAGLGDVGAVLDGRPLTHLDVGTSAGLNLLLGRLKYRFATESGDHALVGAEAATDAMTIEADVRGALSLPGRLPPIAARCGLDLRPIDLADDDSRRWLEACVWPDQVDRFVRLRRAIAMATDDPPRIVVGDAVSELTEQVEQLRLRGVPLVTTTWVMNYLTTDQQTAFVETLDQLGAHGDLVWVFAEAPARTPGLPHLVERQHEEHRTAVTRVVWRDGARRVEHVGIGHPHGYWIHAGSSPTES